MEIKLVINGSDQRVRITPRTSADKKLLEFIVAWDRARLRAERETHGTNIKSIDLILENEPIEDGGKEMDLPLSDLSASK